MCHEILDAEPDVFGDGNAHYRDKTPLMYALQCNHFFIVGHLLDRGANASARMCGGPKSSVIALAVRFVVMSRSNRDMVEGGAFIGAIYGEEEKARELGLQGDLLRAYRRERLLPIVDQFERWLAAVKPTLLPSEPLMAAVQYYLRHRDALFRFIDDPAVAIDNSPTERELQNVAKLRLNMLFAGSTEGANRACVLLGIIATCRAVGVPIQAYLAWVFERLDTHRDLFGLQLEEMTPAAFKKTLA